MKNYPRRAKIEQYYYAHKVDGETVIETRYRILSITATGETFETKRDFTTKENAYDALKKMVTRE